MMRVATCQMNEQLGKVDAVRDAMMKWAERAQRNGAELVVFPEGVLHGYVLDAGFVESHAVDVDTLHRHFAATRTLDVTLVFGAFVREGSSIANAAVTMRRGRVEHVTRKRTLIGPERALFVAGTDSPPIDVGPHRVAIVLCSDTRTEAHALEARRQGATHVVCLANNMLPESAALAWKHRHLPVRADFARIAACPLISSDVTGARPGHLPFGPTCIQRPDGRVFARLPLGRPGLLVADV